jgi:hypothetical protein
MLENLRLADISNIPLPKIKWIVGVPGCGKTYAILNNHKPGKDLILTLTKHGCTEIRKQMASKLKVKINDLKENYRTVASILVNGSSKKVETVYIDEALLMHSGTIGFIAHMTGANEIIIIGDEWQIPYIEREGVSDVLFSSPRKYCHVTSVLTCTRRCPVDVTYALSYFYPGIYTKNTTTISMKMSHNTGLIADNQDTLYMTHTQKDKQSLINLGLGKRNGSAIMTIHEAQGQTFDNVTLIRLNRKNEDIYMSTEHAIVAISRHRKSFLYLTQAGEDKVIKLMKSVGNCEKSLEKWNSEQALRNDIGLDPESMIKSREPILDNND